MNEFRSILETLDRRSAELDQLRDRRGKIEERKDQVRQEIYQKLCAEYDAKISDAEKALDAAAESLRQDTAALNLELATLADAVEQADLAIEELELRHFIGEYESKQDFEASMDAKKAKRDDLKKRLSELRSQVALAESVLEKASGAASDARPPVIADTQPLPSGLPADGDGTHPSAGPALDETIDIRGTDELSSTVAAPGDPNPMPMFGDPDGLEIGGGTDHGAASNTEAPSAAVTLNYLDQTREVRIEGYPFTIGRSTKNALSLKSEEISRYHAQIRFEKGAFVLEDLGSANGTKLDGKRIQRAELKPGGRISLGPAEITFTLSSG
jgi:hypothetical protein